MTASLEELEQEHSGEDGSFAEFDKINKAVVTARLKEIKGDKEAADEIEILDKWLELNAQEADLKKQLKEADAALDTKVYNRYSDADIAHLKKQLEYFVNVREIIRKASGETIDLKAYEADMRHLIDTYIQADEPRKISMFDNMSLVELIVKTGIADAIATRLGEFKGNKDAIAETIENNVRSKIIKEHLNDPAYYDRISTLLDEIIASRRAKAVEYEEYLNRIAELAKNAEVGHAGDMPAALDTAGKRALYNNLERNEDLALRIDEAVKSKRPDAWRGVQPREQQIKRALYDVLKNVDEVERIFVIIKAQREY